MRLSRAVPLLSERLFNEKEEPDVVDASAYALGNIGGEKAVNSLSRSRYLLPLAFSVHYIENNDEFRSIASMLLSSSLSEKCWVYRAIGLRKDTFFMNELINAISSNESLNRGHASLALARIGRPEHYAIIQTAYRESSDISEQVLTALSVISIGMTSEFQDFFATIRKNLAVESFLYKRLTREDIIDVLRNDSNTELKHLASVWEPIYEMMADY